MLFVTAQPTRHGLLYAIRPSRKLSLYLCQREGSLDPLLVQDLITIFRVSNPLASILGRVALDVGNVG